MKRVSPTGNSHCYFNLLISICVCIRSFIWKIINRKKYNGPIAKIQKLRTEKGVILDVLHILNTFNDHFIDKIKRMAIPVVLKSQYLVELNQCSWRIAYPKRYQKLLRISKIHLG